MQSEYNGEPGCKTNAEVNQCFRNYWNPTSYFVCPRIGEEAISKRCPANHLFSDETQTCVEWKYWHWTEPKDPPSKPDPRKSISKQTN